MEKNEKKVDVKNVSEFEDIVNIVNPVTRKIILIMFLAVILLIPSKLILSTITFPMK